MGRRKQDLAQLVGILLLTALVSGAAFYWLGRIQADAGPLEYTVCSEEHEPGRLRCPPRAGKPVLGYWQDGSSATVIWDGKRWLVAVPGGHSQAVQYPATWRDPARE